MATEFEKQPGESKLYQFDFTNGLEDSETISSINSLTFVNLGRVDGSSDITISGQTISSKFVQCRIAEGQDHEEYQVTCKVTTTLSNILELDGILHIRDD